MPKKKSNKAEITTKRRSKVKLPDKVKVKNKTYHVEVEPNIGKGTWGECSNDGYIYIKDGLSRSNTISTFIHEVLHALLEFEGKMTVKHKDIYKMERLIYKFLKDNGYI